MSGRKKQKTEREPQSHDGDLKIIKQTMRLVQLKDKAY